MSLPELVPLEVLFGNPDKAAAQVSPDGSKVAYLAPSEKDVLNVWIRSLEGGDDRMITNDTLRGIRTYDWAEDSAYIMYLQDVGGDENWHLWAQALDGSPARNLTPFDGVRAQNTIYSHRHPGHVLVGLNKRDKTVFDMYRIDIGSGEAILDTENPGDVLTWLTDDDFQIRGAMSMNPADGSKTLRVRDTSTSEFRDLITWPMEEEGAAVAFSLDGQSVFVKSSIGSDTERLIRISTAGGGEILEEVAANESCDAGDVVMDETTRRVQAVSFTYLRKEWTVVDPEVKEDFKTLQGLEEGELSITSQSTGGSVWVVSYARDDGPTSFYAYERATRKTTFLFVSRADLQRYTLSHMEGVVVTARDGLPIPCYLALPPPQGDAAPQALPLVLVVHGGPWARDFWGFNPTVQWLTNRGYAVILTNYRGSTGFGKTHLHKGDKEWGVGSMQHDLTDVVNWAVEKGIADPARVAIYGGSYGGYACLAGLTFTPDLYCCGVDIVGPSHIRTLFQSIPPYWAPMRKLLVERVGDVEADDDLNRRISPFYHADQIRVPLIIGQGANDPRVKKAESDQIYEAMKAKGLAVEYYLYQDEGHGFARPPNRLDFTSRADCFLAQHLGGRCEPPLNMKDTSVKIVHEDATS